ncbi:hypothetical protein N7481_000244 [Penicillium waksmanii]|uniref:uncharacterized protein n=1 Tax=Penicillium waksmanii TaxID=69791 RepID=UPI0025481847|nr:uncharacterized protein N7481_000244 [Penicillium waksmanii]KAJ5999835.1 hypothetical protein N7481_000244 [Penicillium waksmanii]
MAAATATVTATAHCLSARRGLTHSGVILARIRIASTLDRVCSLRPARLKEDQTSELRSRRLK